MKRIRRTKVKVNRIRGKIVTTKVKDDNIMGVKIMSSQNLVNIPKKHTYMTRMKQLIQEGIKNSGMSVEEILKKIGEESHEE